MYQHKKRRIFSLIDGPNFYELIKFLDKYLIKVILLKRIFGSFQNLSVSNNCLEMIIKNVTLG